MTPFHAAAPARGVGKKSRDGLSDRRGGLCVGADLGHGIAGREGGGGAGGEGAPPGQLLEGQEHDPRPHGVRNDRDRPIASDSLLQDISQHNGGFSTLRHCNGPRVVDHAGHVKEHRRPRESGRDGLKHGADDNLLHGHGLHGAVDLRGSKRLETVAKLAQCFTFPSQNIRF